MPVDHLMVPLDGSALAESAMPLALHIARRHCGRITLLHAMELRPPATVHSDRHLVDAADAAKYLHATAESLSGGGVTVDWHVHENTVRDVARCLASHAVELHCDLVVMATHGHGGAKRWVYGSIAQQVAAAGPCPVLFVPCGGCPANLGCEVRTVLVPLDGDPSHEQVLAVAKDLAQSLRATLRLLTVIPMVGDLEGSRAAVARTSPRTMAAALELECGEAERYLRDVRSRWLGSPLPAEATRDLIERGDPVQVILDHSATMGPTLLALGTHRKTGAVAAWSGSVAARVASRAKCPVGLVPCSRQ
jgi:nucleotide-binding universal stress UspA family protein